MRSFGGFLKHKKKKSSGDKKDEKKEKSSKSSKEKVGEKTRTKMTHVELHAPFLPAGEVVFVFGRIQQALILFTSLGGI